MNLLFVLLKTFVWNPNFGGTENNGELSKSCFAQNHATHFEYEYLSLLSISNLLYNSTV